MITLFRILGRSGGLIVVCLTLLALGLYGIANLSVILVDDPERGFKILAVFLVLSVAFLLGLRWAMHRFFEQMWRPLSVAREKATNIVSTGNEGSRAILRVMGETSRLMSSPVGTAGRVLRWAVSRMPFRGAWALRRSAGK